ncbi:U3 small nucleolar RNA-associated protein 14 homolog A [Aplysia californica]|uniref:U3 small nucleolar RNA-associated protein 14 homolog A n=1 Tax=Aplysia californica TaxID=6500 RepID=A0ABM0K3Z9_APLCA|nr:U3 small nucleolar RNA-associated protein 14 homolog A [Aplysia californica]
MAHMADEDIGMESFDMSDDEDKVDDAAHGKLISSIQSLDGKKKHKKTIRGIPVAPTNLDLVVHANRDASKIKAEDLKLRPNLGKTELKKPMSSGELEAAKRQIARDSMVKETTKWDPVVREMRLAPQTSYTKREHGIALYETLRPKQFVPRTPLEQELYAALGKSEDILKPDKEMTVAEEKALKAMSIKEARARRAELMQHHELLSRMELKAKRLKRIKSKRYRKILRKEKEAVDKKELEQLRHTDPEAFMERMEQLERARMEERLTLKHRGGGKFSRLHKAYSKFDDKTRTAVQDMLQKSKELTKKTHGDSSSDDEEEEEEKKKKDEESAKANDSDEDTGVSNQRAMSVGKSVSKLAGGWLDGPTKFVYTQKEAASQNAASGADEVKGHREVVEGQGAPPSSSEDGKLGNSSQKVLPDVNGLDSEDETGLAEKPTTEKKVVSKKKRSAAEMAGSADSEDPLASISTTTEEVVVEKSLSEEPKSKKRKKNKKKKGKEGAGEEVSEGAADKPVRETTLQAMGDDEREKEMEEEEEDDGEGSMKVSMEELFQDEDFLEEFAKDKAELEAKSRPKVEDTTLPGWGAWAGPDYKEMPKKKAGNKKRPPKKVDKQPFVWLNPSRDEGIRKLQPKKVPFPYQSVTQYEASLRQPVSRGLVRETATKLLTKPAVVTKLGHIIKAIDKEDYFEKKSTIEADDEDKNFGVAAAKEGGAKRGSAGKQNNKRRSLR